MHVWNPFGMCAELAEAVHVAVRHQAAIPKHQVVQRGFDFPQPVLPARLDNLRAEFKAVLTAHLRRNASLN